MQSSRRALHGALASLHTAYDGLYAALSIILKLRLFKMVSLLWLCLAMVNKHTVCALCNDLKTSKERGLYL